MIRQLQGCCPCEKSQLELSELRGLLSIWQLSGQSGFCHSPTLCPQSHSCLPCWPQKLPLFFRNFCFWVLKVANLTDFGSQNSVLKHDKKYKVTQVSQGQSAFLSVPTLSVRCEYHSPTLGFLVPSQHHSGHLSCLSWQPVSSTKAAELCWSFIFCLLIVSNRFSICRLET